jgi:hypothetical protein
MIDERNVPFIQCKMSLRRKLDDLSLISIDFYVPALTPPLNSTETSLQLEKITLFMVCRPYTGVISIET